METQETKQRDPIEELQVQIKVVHTLRTTVANLKQEREKRYEAWENENRGLLEAIAEEIESLSGQENSLRELTIKAYEQTGSKAPAPGVSVKIFQTLEYDPKQAWQWGIEHHGIGLKLDVPSFEKVVKATPDIVDFVTIKDEPRAQIATKLEV